MPGGRGSFSDHGWVPVLFASVARRMAKARILPAPPIRCERALGCIFSVSPTRGWHQQAPISPCVQSGRAPRRVVWRHAARSNRNGWIVYDPERCVFVSFRSNFRPLFPRCLKRKDEPMDMTLSGWSVRTYGGPDVLMPVKRPLAVTSVKPVSPSVVASDMNFSPEVTWLSVSVVTLPTRFMMGCLSTSSISGLQPPGTKPQTDVTRHSVAKDHPVP